VNGEDIIFAMTSLGFENYAEVLKIYLAKYRQVCPFKSWVDSRVIRRHLLLEDRVRERAVRARD
jgi:hypothetical protein